MERREETCRSIIDVLSSRMQDNKRAESNYLPAVASFIQPLPRHRHTRTVIIYMCMLAQVKISRRKRGRQSPSYNEGFRGRLINWQTVNYRARKKVVIKYYIQLPLLFFPAFSLALRYFWAFCFPSLPLYTVDFSSHDPLLVFLLSLSAFSRPRMILLFHTWSSFIHLKSVFASSFSFSLDTSPSVLLPFYRLAFFAALYLLPFLRTVVPFPSVFPFSYATLFLPSQPYGRSRIQNVFSEGRSGGTHNYMYAPGLPVRKTWKQVRYTQPWRTPCWQTARHGSTSHLHIAVVTPLAGCVGNNTREFL